MFGFATCILNVHKLIARIFQELYLCTTQKFYFTFRRSLVKWKIISKENFVALLSGLSLLLFGYVIFSVMHNFMYTYNLTCNEL